MKRLLKAAAALVCAFGFTFAHAQLTTITASSISMGGVPIAAGTVTLTPVNLSGIPIAFVTGGGGLNAPTAFSCTITAGAITGSCSIPDAALTSPANILYAVQITNTATQKSFTLQGVANITGSTWALDHYGPPSPTANVQPVQTAYGTAAPPASCVPASVYTQNASGGKFFTCVGGVFVQVSGGVVTYGTTAGTAAQGNDSRFAANAAAAATAQATANTVTPALTLGAMIDLSFKDGSGTTVADASGNGNNGTFTANTPVWVGNGLSFTVVPQGVSLPAAVNSAETFEFAVYVNPLTAAKLPSNQYPMLMTSSLGNTGLTAQLLNGKAPSQFGFSTWANATAKTGGSQTFSGFHVLTLVCGVAGTTLDHLYIDGVEEAYGGQGASCGFQASGNFVLGSAGVSPFATSGFLGTMYRFRALSAQLTPAQVKTDALALAQDAAARGVDTSPVPLASSAALMHVIGDSISCAWNGSVCADSYSWDSKMVLTNQPTYAIVNWGIFNVTMQAIAGSEANRVARQCTSSASPVSAIVFAGTNDLGSNTALVTYGYLASEIRTLKSAGCKVYVATMISRAGTSSVTGNPTYDAQKNSYDALILQNAKADGADGIIDFAASPLVGADGAYASATYFLVDNTHLTAAGEAQLAVAASNSLNYYHGYSLASPNVITATTYTLASGDRAVTAAPTANAAYTMPDCTGPSGESYTISNPQSTYTLTVTGGTSQPINGLTSAITIPASSTATLRDVPNPKTVSGCHWVM